jgi:hypothetical protein
MDRDHILPILKTSPMGEWPPKPSLRRHAHDLITQSSPEPDESTLPKLLLDLLHQVIKAMFTKTQHPSLTSTGRKNLLPPQPASLINARFLNDPLEDENLTKPWRNDFTVPLLDFIVQSYMFLPYSPPDVLQRKTAIEAHFHLLIPALLNLIDDISITPYKSGGCRLLSKLNMILISTQSDMLKQTGLADVFFDALKPNLLLLPELTTEDESLILMKELFPAYMSTIEARFLSITTLETQVTSPGASKQPFSAERKIYQSHVSHLYRAILSSLTHLSPSAHPFVNPTHLPLTIYLIRQIPPIFRQQGLPIVQYFQSLVPAIRQGLMDPFVLAAPEMVLAMIDILEAVMEVGSVRVREKWWTEVLRGIVGCWCNCLDEQEDANDGERDYGQLDAVMNRLRDITKQMGAVVDETDWKAAKRKLIGEESELEGLFEG